MASSWKACCAGFVKARPPCDFVPALAKMDSSSLILVSRCCVVCQSRRSGQRASVHGFCFVSLESIQVIVALLLAGDTPPALWLFSATFDLSLSAKNTCPIAKYLSIPA